MVADELVALGASLQDASILHGCAIDEVAQAWDLGAGTVIEPDRRVDSAAIRGAYAAATEANS